MLPHAEIVVGAPDHDLTRAGGRVPNSVGKAPGDALEIGKDPIAALVAQTVEGRREKLIVIHAMTTGCPTQSFLEGF
jgi:hypothetical protein